MKFAHFFVDRPIFATVIAVVIMLLGGYAYTTLPVSQYPDVVPPTIVVSASYPGASAETVANAVATPLEQEINGVDDMIYMLSQSTGDGRVQITVTFRLGTDLDTAQVLVQNRVSVAEPRLPEEVRRLGVTTRKSSPDLMMVIHLNSPDGSLDQLYISNYATLQIRDVLSRINGVGDVQIFGARDYSMRIWLDPDRMAELDLAASDVLEAIRAQNVEVASGVLGQQPIPGDPAFELTIETQGRLDETDDFEDIVIASRDDGRLVRIRDVGRVEIGAQDYLRNAYLDERQAVALGIFQRPGTNALDTAAELQAMISELAEAFPEGLGYEIIYNPTEFIQESVDAVVRSILEAAILVIIVVIIFLQTWRAAVIPIVAIPVSLIGTFAVMAALGFSLNTLTLFGLVLAIGIVVDDAIIVVENVERNIRDGLSPNEATHRTVDEVGGAIVATSLVLVAVFVPATLITGITGQFFRQFAVTIAVSTVISSIVSLSLSPAMAALLLKSHDENQRKSWIARPSDWFFDKFNKSFDRLSNGYGALTKRLVRISAFVLVVYAGLIALTGWQFQQAPTGFVPEQDQGYLITVVNLPPGASLDRTDEVVLDATTRLLEIDGVAHTAGFAGFDGATFTNAPNKGAIFTVLESFEERAAKGLTSDQILNQARAVTSQIQDAFIFVIAPPPIRGIGTGGGFKLYVEDRLNQGIDALDGAKNALIQAANQTPGLVQVFSPFETGTPKIYADIDRVKAEMLNVPVENVFETLRVYLGSAFANDFNYLGRVYRVQVQADGNFRMELEDVEDLRARSADGEMVPIGSIATFRDIAGPYRVPHYNLYTSAAVQGSTTPAISTGEAIQIIERLAAEVLPQGFDFEWTELAYQEQQAGSTAIYVFIAAAIFVFLFLAAQYESWLLPLAVILIVPMCLLAGVTGVGIAGIPLNLLVQIGFVVLVGLAAKNAILIVEFAKQAEEEGMSRLDAAVHAARVRLRPIMMTSFAFILGVVPLVIAEGAGAENRQALGTAVFSGMIGVTAFGLLFTPVFYTVCRALARDGKSAEVKTADQSAT